MKRFGATLLLTALLVWLAFATAACAPREESRPRLPASPDETGTPTQSALPVDQITLELEEVALDFERPLFVTNAGDGSGRLFVVEQRGTVFAVRDGEVSRRPFLDVGSLISDGGERGLLGLAFAPDYEDSGVFYINYTDRRGDTVVARYKADDPASDSPSLSKPEVVLKVDQPYANHNGGCTVFGPDGRLWVGMGDGGAGGDPESRAQDDGELLGKLLAIEVGSGDKPEVSKIAKGLRNPWRFSFDRETGDLWIGDVGQSAYEEIDFVASDEVKPGLNFGWNLWEGNHPYPEGSKRSKSGLVFPVIEHPRDEAKSITGGYVYRGTEQPLLTGTYIYGDFVAGWIAIARRDGSEVAHRIVLSGEGIVPSSFGEDEEGEVYVCDYSGTISRIVASE